MPRRDVLQTEFQDIDWDKPDTLVDFARTRWASRDDRRRQQEMLWFVSLAFFRGFHYIRWDEARRTLQFPENTPAWRVRAYVNLSRRTVLKRISQAMRMKPRLVVSPATTDNDDVAVAHVATSVLDYYGRWLRTMSKLYRLYLWTFTCGDAFLRVFWDRGKGQEMPINRAEVEANEDLMRSFRRRFGRRAKSGRIRTGDLNYEVVSPFEIDPDESAEMFDDCRFILHSKSRSIDWLRARYPDTTKDLRPLEGDQTASFDFQRRIKNLVGLGDTGNTQGQVQNPEGQKGELITHELWVRPLPPDLPKGAYAVIAGDRLLNPKTYKKLPYDHEDIPYAHFQEIHEPGSFWGASSMRDGISMNSLYNRMRSQMVEMRNTMSMPKWFVPRGANLKPDALTDEPGEVVKYTPGFRPDRDKFDPFPESIMREAELTRRDYEDAVGIHEVSNAKAPANVRSGLQVAELQEQDDTVMAPVIFQFEERLEQVGVWSLKTLRQFATEPRMLTITGEDEVVETLSFTGRKLVGEKPGANYYNVRVELGSQFPLSRPKKQEFIGALVDRQLINPANPKDRAMALRMLDISQNDFLFDEQRQERTNAQMENVNMRQGVIAAVNPWDDHMLHDEEHTRELRKPTLPPEAKSLIYAHLQLHRRELARLGLAAQGQNVSPGLQEPTLPELPGIGGAPLELGAGPAAPPQGQNGSRLAGILEGVEGLPEFQT